MFVKMLENHQVYTNDHLTRRDNGNSCSADNTCPQAVMIIFLKLCRRGVNPNILSLRKGKRREEISMGHLLHTRPCDRCLHSFPLSHPMGKVPLL